MTEDLEGNSDEDDEGCGVHNQHDSEGEDESEDESEN